MLMAHKLVRRDQFNISPQGIVHKPTDAAFTPDPTAPCLQVPKAGRRPTFGGVHRNGLGAEPACSQTGQARESSRRKLFFEPNIPPEDIHLTGRGD
jgi:hypothetical protein